MCSIVQMEKSDAAKEGKVDLEDWVWKNSHEGLIHRRKYEEIVKKQLLACIWQTKEHVHMRKDGD